MSDEPKQETPTGELEVVPLNAKVFTGRQPDSLLSVRQKALRAAGVGVALLAFVALLLTTSMGQSSMAAVGAVLAGPTPTATPLGADMFYVYHGVPWGSLLVDGHALPVAGVSGGLSASAPDSGWPAFTLRSGKHTLRYDAAPFPALTCVASVPASPKDTCPLVANDVARGQLRLPVPDSARVLNLGASYLHLASSDRASLVVATEQALNPTFASLSLAAGDHYVTDSASECCISTRVATASGPLVATRQFKLWTYPGAIPSDGVQDIEVNGPCWPFCDTSPVISKSISPAGELLLSAQAMDDWTYMGPDGQVVLADSPNSMYLEPALMQVTVAVTWSGGWKVRAHVNWNPNETVPGQEFNCEAALSTFGNQEQAGLFSPDDYTWHTVPASHNESECVITGASTSAGHSNPQPILLFRCGALLAVNSDAAHLFPSLLLTSAHERTIAQSILAGGA
jgi:hypothetical protein